MKMKDRTTRLPRELRERIDQDTGSNRMYGKSGKQVPRKQARKVEKLQKKQKKAEYFSHGAISLKRRAVEEPEGAPPKKRVKRESGRQETMKAIKSVQKASSKPAKESEITPEAARPSITALEKLATRQLKLAKSVNSQARTDEDREIAWLEYKLGIKGKAPRSKIFEEDGLGDLLDGLDDLMGGEPPSNPGGDTITEDEAGRMSDNAEEKDNTAGGYSRDEEWAGISKGGQEQENESECSDSKMPRPVPLVDPSPTRTMSAGKYIPPHLRQTKNEDDEAKTRLSRQLKGLINRLSDQNMATIVSEIGGLYQNNKRNDVTTTLIAMIISSIADHSSLLDHHVVLHAALVAALYRIVGAELAAHCVQEAVLSHLSHYQVAQSPSQSRDDGEIKGKECSNLMVLLCELYNLQVISCILMYDLIRSLLSGVVTELDVEILLKILRTSGTQLRQDDPLALRDIVSLVNERMAGRQTSMSSREKFMLEALSDLKHNKVRKTSGGPEVVERMKKFLSGLGRTQHLMPHEPLRVTLEDLQSSETRGKWWLIGAAWSGDPLVDEKRKKRGVLQVANEAVDEQNQVLLKLARKQGMNTEIRRSVFIVLMSSEDYIDACERLSQLNLTEVQQREIVKVLLHCCGSEKTYNPYYAMIAQNLCQQSHSHKVTLQFCLWDLLREMGEHEVGGVEMLRSRGEHVSSGAKWVSETRRRNTAKAYAWWLAKGSLSLSILKPVEFPTIKADTRQFFELLLRELFVDTQTVMPVMTKDALRAIWENEKRDRSALEAVMIKAIKIPGAAQGLLVLFGEMRRTAAGEDSAENQFVRWALGVSTQTLRTGIDIASTL